MRELVRPIIDRCAVPHLFEMFFRDTLSYPTTFPVIRDRRK